MTDDHWDAVIVGAGLGGLTAGATLAREGQRVLVLEQHAIAGGCATTFDRGDFCFEVSLHEIEGLDAMDPMRRIFEELGVFDAVSFEPIPALYQYRDGQRAFLLEHGDDAIEGLVEAFPHEAAGIERFFDVIASIRASLADTTFDDPSLLELAAFALRNRTFICHRETTVGEFVEECFEDEALKLILLATLGYYHDDPGELSLPFFAVAQGGYLAGGGYYIEGGSQALSDHLAGEIEDHGGAVRTGRQVTAITVADGRVTGVTHEQSRPGTTDSTGGDRREQADAVIANAALPVVADDLLPDEPGQRLAAQFEDWERAPALSTLYLGCETPPSEFGVEQYSTILAPEVTSLQEMTTARTASFGRRPLTLVDYDQIDAGLTETGTVAAVSTLDDIDAWRGLTDAEYRQKKARVESVILRRLDDAFPGLADAVAHAELATPRTIRRYTLNPGGTAYGFAQTPEQSLLNRRIESPVDGLRFASAWAFPGGGFTGAILSGDRAARALLD